MPPLGPMTTIVLLERETAVPKPEGGYTQDWTALLPPTWMYAIAPAASTREQSAAATIETPALYILTGAIHPDVSELVRVTPQDGPYQGRVFNVAAVQIVGFPYQHELLCSELKADRSLEVRR